MNLTEESIKKKIYYNTMFNNSESDIAVDRLIFYIGSDMNFGNIESARYNISSKSEITNIIKPYTLFKRAGDSIEYKYNSDNSSNNRYSICMHYDNINRYDECADISVIASKTCVTINDSTEADQEYSITYTFNILNFGYYVMTVVYVNSAQPPIICFEQISNDAKDFDFDMDYIYNILDEKINDTNNVFFPYSSPIKITNTIINTSINSKEYYMKTAQETAKDAYYNSSINEENIVNLRIDPSTELPIFDYYELLKAPLVADSNRESTRITVRYNGIIIDEYVLAILDNEYYSTMCRIFREYVYDVNHGVKTHKIRKLLWHDIKFNCYISFNTTYNQQQMIVKYFNPKDETITCKSMKKLNEKVEAYKDKFTISLTFTITQSFSMYPTCNIVLKDGDTVITNYDYTFMNDKVLESFNTGNNNIAYAKSYYYYDSEYTSNYYAYQDNNYSIAISEGKYKFNSYIYDGYNDPNINVRFGYLGLPIGKKNEILTKCFEEQNS